MSIVVDILAVIGLCTIFVLVMPFAMHIIEHPMERTIFRYWDWADAKLNKDASD